MNRYARSYSNCEKSCQNIKVLFFLIGQHLIPYSTKKFGPNLLHAWAESSGMWAEFSWVRIFCSFRAWPNILGSESFSTPVEYDSDPRRSDSRRRGFFDLYVEKETSTLYNIRNKRREHVPVYVLVLSYFHWIHPYYLFLNNN